MVIDHTSYSVSEIEGDHTLIASDEFIKSDVILGKEKIEAPMLFKGIAHSVNAANSLAVKVLSASPAAYSANPNSKLSTPPAISGTSICLVSVVQGERMQHNFIQKNKQKAVKWMRRKDERSHSPNILLVNFLTKLSDSVNVLTNHRANTTEFSGQYHASLVVLAQIAMNMSAVLNEL